MSYGWIDGKDFSFNCLLLMDRWIIDNILAWYREQKYMKNFAIALAHNPVVHWYLVNRCPERKDYFDTLVKNAPKCSPEEVRDSEIYVLSALETTVVYAYPEIMDKLSYISEWDSGRLLSITDFTGKTVLDIGSGTGRLAFAAATVAKTVTASEPVDRLREYLREKARRLNMDNVYVIDGTIQMIPFPDDSFDIVMSGHTFGDDFDGEYREMERVTRNGGYIIDCPGEGGQEKDEGPKPELIELAFQYSHYTSTLGGEVYVYWKAIEKEKVV